MNQWEEALVGFSIAFVPFMMAVTFHEFAHGYVAARWGDSTAKDAGRLTLNPIPHLDVFGTVLIPAMMMLSGTGFLFGWAKPVPIDPRNFRSFRPGLFWVAFAGPGMNIILAIFSAFLYVAILSWVPESFTLKDPFVNMAIASIYMNFALCLFNLIPLPPLDGSKMVESFLPLRWIARYENLAKYSFIILIALILTGSLRFIFVPIQFLAEWSVGLAGALLGQRF